MGGRAGQGRGSLGQRRNQFRVSGFKFLLCEARPEGQTPKLETRNSKPETRNSKPSRGPRTAVMPGMSLLHKYYRYCPQSPDNLAEVSHLIIRERGPSYQCNCRIWNEHRLARTRSIGSPPLLWRPFTSEPSRLSSFSPGKLCWSRSSCGGWQAAWESAWRVTDCSRIAASRRRSGWNIS